MYLEENSAVGRMEGLDAWEDLNCIEIIKTYGN
jgi:hypothetical protein